MLPVSIATPSRPPFDRDSGGPAYQVSLSSGTITTTGHLPTAASHRLSLSGSVSDR
jgi:hypothetical protein